MIPAELFREAQKATPGGECNRRGFRLTGDVNRRGKCPLCGVAKDQPFRTNASTKRWRCAACGAGGETVALVQALDKCSFREAVEVLAGERPRGGEGAAIPRHALDDGNRISSPPSPVPAPACARDLTPFRLRVR
jgi:rubredoxin